MGDAPFRLREITFVAGPSGHSAPSRLTPGVVTLLVGPNNSGKSIALTELHAWATQMVDPAQPWPGGWVIAAADATWPSTSDELQSFLGDRLLPPLPDEPGSLPLRSFSLAASAAPTSFGYVIARPTGQSLAEFCRTKILPHYVAMLDGRSRFALTEARTLTNLRAPATNHLMAILRDDDLYTKLDDELVLTFGLHLVIDITQPPSLQVALTPDKVPEGDSWRRALDESAVEFMASAQPLSQFSDGVKMYVGLMMAVASLPHVLLLIDEPEAFLHPSLVRRLGGRLAATARKRNANLIAATHSPDFLLGCVGEVPQTDIVRLTYEAGVATARPLPGREVEKLVSDPLLRSARALQALFARAAVVCEADADRAFYDEINRRLLENPTRLGAADTAFLNAQNWQTIPRIAGPLRRPAYQQR